MRSELEPLIGERGIDDVDGVSWWNLRSEHTSRVRARGLEPIDGVEGAYRSGRVIEDSSKQDT